MFTLSKRIADQCKMNEGSETVLFQIFNPLVAELKVWIHKICQDRDGNDNYRHHIFQFDQSHR